MSLGRMGGVYAALHAGHTVADYWGQTDRMAEVKGKPGSDGQKACAAHVAALTATQAAFLGVACLATGERLSARRVAVGLAVNAASHYAIDRRDHGVMPHLCRTLRRFGHEDFARAGTGLATGAALLDQAWHIGWAAISAAIIAGKD
ncbi:MAG TPA: transcriptional regulator [Micromonospora sp.]|nr:transcriptional regulator [Micromonospora sp.]